MRRWAGLAATLVVVCFASAAASEPNVSYDISVTLDAKNHRLGATQELRWTNVTDSPAADLWFHLYLNAFASSRTTFMRELEGTTLRSARPVTPRWGWIRVTGLETGLGVDLLPAFEFMRPDDGNPDDHTVARVTLPQAVPPGGVVLLRMAFEAQLPGIIARTGYAGDFHLVAQWFPKLGVFEGGDGWNCHQFHADSEFFADFGTFRVGVEVPEGWVIGASGVEVQREVAGGSTRAVFLAQRLHDFAWCAAPGELMTEVEADFEPGRDVPPAWLEQATRLLGRSAAELELAPTHVRLLLPRSQLALADRMVRAARLSFAWYGLHYGAFPYPQLTVVSPPPTAEEAGGMEYPTLITTGASRLHAYPPLSWLAKIERVTVHEFGHQYFQGLLASNELEEAWLDEGLTTYAENECLEALEAGGFISGWRRAAPPWARERVRLATGRVPTRVDTRAWEFRSRSDYVRASFVKAALVLRTVEGLIGREVFARAMRAYVERFRFTHPRGDDLIAILSEFAGEDLGWFFEQALRGDGEADWAVVEARNHRHRRGEGFRWSGGEWRPLDPGGEDPLAQWRVDVQVARLGELRGPVEVELRYADGRSERRTWDGSGRWVEWSFPSDQRLTGVTVDPDGVWALEVRRRDNYWRSGPSAAGRRPLWWLPRFFHLLPVMVAPWS